MLFLDLDDFKLVNDTYGHDTADTLLALVGERISACVRPADLAARLGGDEFAVLLAPPSDSASAATVAQRLLDALAEPFPLRAGAVSVAASIGIATAEGAAATSDDLLVRGMLRCTARRGGARGDTSTTVEGASRSAPRSGRVIAAA